ncbi:MAG: PilZ domain-containing protein [Candidatus Sulfotelmatobacter sp.]
MNPKPSQRRRELHPVNLIATEGIRRAPMAKRRSSRMGLHAAIGLSGKDRQKCAFTMPARATNLNRHGAAVRLNRELAVGSVVQVQNQRGTQVAARVVARLATVEGVCTYAIEFVEQDDRARDFWGISFPSHA